MPDFNVRSDSVNVEQIMEQIRARIREKRGVDYTEQQIRELAAVKLEKFLDPGGVRSDLLDQFRKAQPAYQPPDLPNFAFEEDTLFESHRAPIRWLRKLLMPLLKLLFNPNPLIQALHIQSRLNTMNAEREAQRESARRAMDQLYYELVHNLVVEATRTGIEVKNLKMRVESISSRLEFNERRARALEGVVVYKTVEPDEAPVQRPAPTQSRPQAQPRYAPPSAAPPQVATASATPAPASAQGQPTAGPSQGQGVPGEGPGQRSRRRRRRRGRRGGGAASAVMGVPGSAAPDAGSEAPGDTDAMDPIDALDRVDDDESPESEDMDVSAPGPVEHATVAESQHAAVAAAQDTESPIEHAPEAPPDPPAVEPAPEAHAESAEAAPATITPVESASAEHAPAPPLPDRADHDPQ
ncbi:MAG: hypothetical protein ACRD2I_04480 [Vicinamibacterales bacterium]